MAGKGLESLYPSMTSGLSPKEYAQQRAKLTKEPSGEMAVQAKQITAKYASKTPGFAKPATGAMAERYPSMAAGQNPATYAREANRLEAVLRNAQQEVAQWEAATRADPEIGVGFDDNIGQARQLVAQFGTPELQDILSRTGMGSHPEIIRLAVRVAKAFKAQKIDTATPPLAAQMKEARARAAAAEAAGDGADGSGDGE